MNNILQQIFLGNTIEALLLAIGSILLVVLFKKYLSKYIAGLFYKLVSRTSWKIEKHSFINLLVQPLEVFIVVFVTLVALDRLHFPEILNFEIHKINTKQIADALGTGIFIFTFIWMLLRLIDFVALVMQHKADLTPETADNQLVVFFKDFFKVIIGIIGILLVIRFSFNKDIGALLAGLSIVAGALALAARESLENLIASFIIFFDKPFFVGDVVKVHQITGTVERIGLRSTRIRTEQKTYVTVPNKQMVDSVMDNLTMRTQRKGELRLELDLGTSSDELSKVVEGIKKIVINPLIENSAVFFYDISNNGYIIAVDYFSNGAISLAEFNQLKQDINLQIVQLLEQHKVELAGLESNIKISNSAVDGPTKSRDILG